MEAKPKPTTYEVYTAIETLYSALEAAYGEDFSYQVYGNGCILGASCFATGYVKPLNGGKTA